MIALTRGQLRRRWRAGALTLLGLVPWYALLLSPLLMAFIIKDNKFVLNNGYFALGTCADCCGGGGGCSACVSTTTCTSCAITPTQYTLTLSGGTSCDGGTYNGTWGPLVQVTDGSDPSFCTWVFDDGTETIKLVKIGGTVLIEAGHNPNFDVNRWFQALVTVTPDADCCSSIPAANHDTTCSSGLAGAGGSVVMTPC